MTIFDFFFKSVMLLLLIKPKGYVYSRFQVAFQIVLRILINSNLRNVVL